MHLRHISDETELHLGFDDKSLKMIGNQELERSQNLKNDQDVQIVSPPPMPTFDEVISAFKTLFSILITFLVYLVYILVYLLVFISQTLTTIINGAQVTTTGGNSNVKNNTPSTDNVSTISGMESIGTSIQNGSDLSDVETFQSNSEIDDNFTIKSGPMGDNFTLKTAVPARSEVASIYRTLKGHKHRQKQKEQNISIHHFDSATSQEFNHHLRNCSYCASLKNDKTINKSAKQTPDFTNLAMEPYFATVFGDD